MSLSTLLLIVAGLLVGGLFLYWQLIVAEGAYLGPRVVALTYDVAARRYDRIKQYDPDFETAFLGRPLAALLRDVPSPYVLDVGIGTARLPLALFEQPIFEGHIVGLDSSRRMLSVAAEKVAAHRQRIDLLWKDAASLPFPDATFDAVACLEVLEFTPDPVAQLAECVRVLRPGGLLLTTRRRGLDAWLMPGRTYTAARFEALLETQGVVDVSIQPWQVDYDLVWAMRHGEPGVLAGGRDSLSAVLRCPACGIGQFAPDDGDLTCRTCGTHFEAHGGVVELQRGGVVRQRVGN